MKWFLAMSLAWILCNNSVQAVEPLDEETLGGVHLQGLDAPAAGELRAPVAGEVSSESARNLAKDLDEAAGLSSEDTASTTPPIDVGDPNDVSRSDNLGFDGRRAEVSVQKSVSADRSSSQSTDYGAAINVNNRVDAIGIENARRTPDSPINAGSIFINNLQVESQIKIQQR